jgi:hypothetical protein
MAFKRHDVTADMLDYIFQYEQSKFGEYPNFTRGEIARCAYTSGNPEVVKWAASKGFVPSHKQLRALNDMLGVSIQELGGTFCFEYH